MKFRQSIKLSGYHVFSIFISFLIGMAGGLSFANHFLQFWHRSEIIQWLLVVALALVLTPVLYYLSYHIAWKWAQGYSHQKLLIFISVSIMFGGFLRAVLPIMTPLPPAWHRLEIVATGEKNHTSQGYDIRLLEIRDFNGDIIPLHHLDVGQGWEYDNQIGIMASQNQPAFLLWKFYFFQPTDITWWYWDGFDQKFEITFQSNPTAGIVNIRLDDQSQTVDLYEETTAYTLVITQDVSNDVPENFLWKINLITSEILIITFAVFFCGSLAIKFGQQRLFLLAVIVLLIPSWQRSFIISRSKLDQKYYINADGFTKGDFIYYYYYLDLYPIYSAGEIPESRENAVNLLYQHPDKIFMEVPRGYNYRTGDIGSIFPLLTESHLRGYPSKEMLIVLSSLFMISLLAIAVSAWYVNQAVLGFLLVAFIGSHPLQIYEVYSRHYNIFSLPITITLLVMAFHLPLIFKSKVSTLYLWLLPISCGLLFATGRQIRTETILAIVSMVGLYLLARNLNWRVRLRLCILLFISYWLGVKGYEAYFDYKFQQAHDIVTEAGGKPLPLNAARDRYHTFWHPVWCGLGDFDNKYGYVWWDVVAYDYAKPIMEKEGLLDAYGYYDQDKDYEIWLWMIPGYDEILRDKVVHDILHDPLWYFEILLKRAWRVLTDVAPLRLSVGARSVTLPLSGILLLPTIIYLIYTRRWDYLKLLCFPLPLALTALFISTKPGTTYYSIFLQILAALYILAIWKGVSKYVLKSPKIII